jgi:hypothetical protein
MFTKSDFVRSLKGVGPTLGGESFGINTFLTGYPEDLKTADVTKIVGNKLSVEQMVKKYPMEGNYLASRGYLVFSSFSDANKGSNPLAVRAIFDTFGVSTDSADPILAQQILDEYKANVDGLKFRLVKSKIVGFSAIFTLFFLLGLADLIAYGHLYDGWFPDWPGGQNFPACLVDAKTGPWTIPNYWI